MKIFIRRRLKSSLLPIVLMAAITSTPSASFAEQMTFTIDSSRSSLVLSLDIQPGVPITTAQFPGSDTVSLSGTQTLDVTSNSITFLSTDDVHFGIQPAPVSPANGGVYPGSETGNYGLLASIPGLVGGPGPGGTGLIATRDFLGGVFSNSIPLNGTSFSANETFLKLVSGLVDVNVTLVGQPYQNTLSFSGADINQRASGTLTQNGGIYTLTLPILASSSLTVGAATVLETYTGQLVATARVPEPGTLVLAAVGGLAVIACRRVRPQ